jgi:hypothetical protein
MHRFSMESFSAKTPGLGAGRQVQYLTRTGEFVGHNADRAPVERGDAQFQIEHMTGMNYPSSHRDDLRHIEPAKNLPDWAHGSVTAFFQSAEKHERGGAQRGGQFYTIIEASLPRELDRDQQLALARDFVDAVVADKVHFWVLHEPTASDYLTEVNDYSLPTNHGLQPHIHLMYSTRTIGDGSKGEDVFFKQPNTRYPERGGFGKDRAFGEQGLPLRLRQAWTDCVNVHLERAGVDRRVSADPLWKQGLHPLYAYQEPGAYREKQRHYEPRSADEKAQQQAYAVAQWTQRREALGVDRVDHQALVQTIGRDAKQLKRQRQPEREPSPRRQDFGSHPRMVTRERVQGTDSPLNSAQVQKERKAYPVSLPPPTNTHVRVAQALLQTLRTRQEEEMVGAALQIRLHEREARERGDEGMGW